MTFDKQVKEAETKKLQNRIVRDITFIILGVIFLFLSIILSYNNDKKDDGNNKSKTTIESKKN